MYECSCHSRTTTLHLLTERKTRVQGLNTLRTVLMWAANRSNHTARHTGLCRLHGEITTVNVCVAFLCNCIVWCGFWEVQSEHVLCNTSAVLTRGHQSLVFNNNWFVSWLCFCNHWSEHISSCGTQLITLRELFKMSWARKCLGRERQTWHIYNDSSLVCFVSQFKTLTTDEKTQFTKSSGKLSRLRP